MECARWIDSAIRFCGSARVLIEKSDGTLLREYLYADEDIMKREAVRLLEAVSSDTESKTRQRDYSIIALFLNTGMRLSELVGLKP